jgi:hypothetical protein
MKKIYKCCNQELEYRWKGLLQYVRCPSCGKEKITGKVVFPVFKKDYCRMCKGSGKLHMTSECGIIDNT